jgi:hypothetical protein
MTLMQVVSRTGWVVWFAGMAVMAGCDSPEAGPARSSQQSAADFTMSRIPNVDAAAVRPAALQVFKQYFRLDADASSGMVLRSRATETESRGDREQAGVREILSGRGDRHRQLAELHIIGGGAGVTLRCQVRVQRLETVERSAFAPIRGGDDRPAESKPLGRSEASETRASTDWVNVGRDRQMERQILDEIGEAMGGAPASQPAVTTRPAVP